MSVFYAIGLRLNLRADLPSKHVTHHLRSGHVRGDDEPRDSAGERRLSEAPPGAGGDTSAYGRTTAARRRPIGIKKLFGELKKATSEQTISVS